jgi:hypothetical protein
MGIIGKKHGKKTWKIWEYGDFHIIYIHLSWRIWENHQILHGNIYDMEKSWGISWGYLMDFPIKKTYIIIRKGISWEIYENHDKYIGYIDGE